MKNRISVLIAVVVILVVVIIPATYVIPEGRQAVIVQFGDPVRQVTEAGLYWKIPFIQDVVRLEKRLLPWDGAPTNIPTGDKRRIYIDVWGRWRITNPLTFYQVVATEQIGQKRLDEVVESAVKAVVSRNKLIEAVRTTDTPLEYESEELEKDWSDRAERVKIGRRQIEKEIQELASEGLEDKFGIELVAVHIKRINYIDTVRQKVYERMRSERTRIASLYESEAQEERNRILGQTQKELLEIEGDREQKSAEIRGEADAKVIEIAAGAFGKSPEFYKFLRQLEAYKETLGAGTRLVLSTENEFLRLIHGMAETAEEK